MLKRNKISLAVAAVALTALASQQAVAHTRLTVSSTQESSAAHGTTTTAVNIPHGCGDNAVIGNVFFYRIPIALSFRRQPTTLIPSKRQKAIML